MIYLYKTLYNFQVSTPTLKTLVHVYYLSCVEKAIILCNNLKPNIIFLDLSSTKFGDITLLRKKKRKTKVNKE